MIILNEKFSRSYCLLSFFESDDRNKHFAMLSPNISSMKISIVPSVFFLVSILTFLTVDLFNINNDGDLINLLNSLNFITSFVSAIKSFELFGFLYGF